MSENPNRRDFLGKFAVSTGAAGLVAANGVGECGAAPRGDSTGLDAQGAETVPTESKEIRPKSTPAPTSATTGKTLLAIGAHYDDCVFGIPGILLEAVRKQYRVVILNIIGDYAKWSPVKGRAEQLRATNIRLASERGIEVRFLDYASMHFDVNADTKRAVAEVVADVKPDVAFMLWRRDRHPDHEVASVLSEMALRQPGAILGRPGVRAARRIYAYDNGPGHTIGFEPNTFVDVTAAWPAAMEWLGQLMAFVRNRPYDPQSPDRTQTVKQTLAEYRGLACGVKYAEAVWATRPEPREIL
ncbi:MAG: PIG-L family deacetylase [Planctomycetes bacterium]|nr:PIG-L family deacetylase [Planctomycetota bacterium]MBL7037000.1 PIG-L family deacetylase [Pirellulaceae bacterium]